MSWDELCQRDADIIVALPCGFDLAKTMAEMMLLYDRAEWGAIAPCPAITRRF